MGGLLSSPSARVGAAGAQLYRRPRGCQTLFLIVLCWAVAGCAGNEQEIRRDAQTSFKLGAAFLAEGRPAPALRELTKAETLTPEDPEVQYYLGAAYWMRREYALAEEKFRNAVKLKPDYADAWNDLGALYMDQGRFHDAVPACENALKNVFYSTQERALTNLGWSLHRLGRSTEAERKLRDAIEVAPGFPLAHKFLGVVLQERGDHRAAVDEFDQAIRLYPDDPETHLKRGLSLLRLGERAAAKQAFETAWRLAPGTDLGRSAKTYLDLLEQG